MKLRDCIIIPQNLEPYHPEAHTTTTNRRLIGQETVGARKLEVVLGVVEPGGRAEKHSHPGVEQVVFIIEGRCLVEMWGESGEVGPGEAVFFPPGVAHRITALGDRPGKALVIYSPPIQTLATPFETEAVS